MDTYYYKDALALSAVCAGGRGPWMRRPAGPPRHEPRHGLSEPT